MDTTFNPNDYPTYQIGDRVTIRHGTIWPLNLV